MHLSILNSNNLYSKKSSTDDILIGATRIPVQHLSHMAYYIVFRRSIIQYVGKSITIRLKQIVIFDIRIFGRFQTNISNIEAAVLKRQIADGYQVCLNQFHCFISLYEN